MRTPPIWLRSNKSLPGPRGDVRFLIDADVSPAVAAFLESTGHDAAYVPALFPPRTLDPVVATYARETERCIVTRDFGFADIRRYAPREHHGIVVLAVPPDGGTRHMLDLMRDFLARLPELEPLRGKLLIVEPKRIRVRES